MKSLFINDELRYDGTQLRPQFAYFNYKLLGNSIISWIGACDISFEHMVDGEDLLERSLIKGDQMLHFIIEIFDCKIMTAVTLQRLFAAIVQQTINEQIINKKEFGNLLKRAGDDLFLDNKKLSISIASSSVFSSQIHFAANITTSGTPVLTTSLDELKLKTKDLSMAIMSKFCEEFQSIIEATQKVKELK